MVNIPWLASLLHSSDTSAGLSLSTPKQHRLHDERYTRAETAGHEDAAFCESKVLQWTQTISTKILMSSAERQHRQQIETSPSENHHLMQAIPWNTGPWVTPKTLTAVSDTNRLGRLGPCWPGWSPATQKPHKDCVSFQHSDHLSTQLLSAVQQQIVTILWGFSESNTCLGQNKCAKGGCLM
jgi:hypothetical protein